jgi:zinc protease
MIRRHPKPTGLIPAGLLLVLALLLAMPAGAEVRLPAYSRTELPNGAVLLLAEKHDVPLVAIDIGVRGGSLADPDGRDGTAALLAELMQKGAGARDAAAFAEAVDAVGGELSIDAERGALRLSAEFLAEDAALMVELAAQALTAPRLDADEFMKVRERAVQSLAAAKDGAPDRLIALYGSAWLFRDHPYGRPVGGSEATLARIGHDDVTAFHRQQLGGDRLVIAVVGAFDPARMQALLADAFGGWRAAGGALPEIDAKARERGRRVLLVDKPGATQTYFWLGNVGVSRTDPARVAQNLVNTLFGGRFTSMLNSELRVRTGLTYGARASLTRLPQPGPVAITSFTRTDATVQAIELAVATLERLHVEGLDESQLASARNYLLGQFPPTLETAPQIAAQLATLELHGLDRDEVDGYGARVRAVDEAAARTATAAYPRGDDLVIVLIGDAARIRDEAARFGPVTEMPITAPQFRPTGE